MLKIILGLLLSLVATFQVAAKEKVELSPFHMIEMIKREENRLNFESVYIEHIRKQLLEQSYVEHMAQRNTVEVNSSNAAYAEASMDEIIRKLHGSSKLYKAFQKRRFNLTSTSVDLDSEYDINFALALAVAKFKLNEEKTKRDATIGLYATIPFNF